MVRSGVDIDLGNLVFMRDWRGSTGFGFEADSMHTPVYEIACLVRECRRALKITQRFIAALIGCSQPYIAQIETARRPISLKFALLLEELFGVEPGTFQRADFSRGRPPLPTDGCAVLTDIQQAQGRPIIAKSDTQPPGYARPDLAKPRDNPFLFNDLSLLLDRNEGFWIRARAPHFDSGCEKKFFLDAASRSCGAVRASFQSLGCTLHSANGKTGRDTNHLAYPALLLRYKDMAVAMLPQRCIRTVAGYRWPDCTLVAAVNGRKLTLVAEVDGPTHVGSERMRDQEIGVPVYHLPADRAGQPGELEKLLDWARDRLLSA